MSWFREGHGKFLFVVHLGCNEVRLLYQFSQLSLWVRDDRSELRPPERVFVPRKKKRSAQAVQRHVKSESVCWSLPVRCQGMEARNTVCLWSTGAALNRAKVESDSMVGKARAYVCLEPMSRLKYTGVWRPAQSLRLGEEHGPFSASGCNSSFVSCVLRISRWQEERDWSLGEARVVLDVPREKGISVCLC